ncbi:MAG: hypothetical protein M3P43_10450 [Actinomycetota bacterium]|nr:hypothetical protein [Actinomycetota bacterium]
MSVDGRLRNELTRDASDLDVDVDRFLGDVVRGGRRRQRIRRVGGAVVVMALIAAIAVVGPAVIDVVRHQRIPAHQGTPAPGAIEGTYAVEIKRADASGAPGLQLEGLWQFTLRGDGLVSVTGPAGANVSTPRSQYQLEGDRLLTTAFASDTCQGVGVYRWSREGSTLSFTLVSDTCPVRVVLFTAHPWQAR